MLSLSAGALGVPSAALSAPLVIVPAARSSAGPVLGARLLPESVSREIGDRSLRVSRAAVRAQARPVVRRTVVRRVARPSARVVAVRRAMSAVTGYARSKVGSRYVHGAAGPRSFDCSGLVMRAYQRAGRRLPHSSRAQAARAYWVPRSKARAGDLVVGPGHVGIYMGRGMMIDAGNQRVGVSYRRVYRGLWIERLP